MPGRFCDKHQEYAASGECRWCETPATMGVDFTTPPRMVLAAISGEVRQYAATSETGHADGPAVSSPFEYSPAVRDAAAELARRMDRPRSKEMQARIDAQIARNTLSFLRAGCAHTRRFATAVVCGDCGLAQGDDGKWFDPKTGQAQVRYVPWSGE